MQFILRPVQQQCSVLLWAAVAIQHDPSNTALKLVHITGLTRARPMTRAHQERAPVTRRLTNAWYMHIPTDPVANRRHSRRQPHARRQIRHANHAQTPKRTLTCYCCSSVLLPIMLPASLLLPGPALDHRGQVYLQGACVAPAGSSKANQHSTAITAGQHSTNRSLAYKWAQSPQQEWHTNERRQKLPGKSNACM
jgi:hypothetical protein